MATNVAFLDDGSDKAGVLLMIAFADDVVPAGEAKGGLVR